MVESFTLFKPSEDIPGRFTNVPPSHEPNQQDYSHALRHRGFLAEAINSYTDYKVNVSREWEFDNNRHVVATAVNANKLNGRNLLTQSTFILERLSASELPLEERLKLAGEVLFLTRALALKEKRKGLFRATKREIDGPLYKELVKIGYRSTNLSKILIQRIHGFSNLIPDQNSFEEAERKLREHYQAIETDLISKGAKIFFDENGPSIFSVIYTSNSVNNALLSLQSESDRLYRVFKSRPTTVVPEYPANYGNKLERTIGLSKPAFAEVEEQLTPDGLLEVRPAYSSLVEDSLKAIGRIPLSGEKSTGSDNRTVRHVKDEIGALLAFVATDKKNPNLKDQVQTVELALRERLDGANKRYKGALAETSTTLKRTYEGIWSGLARTVHIKR